MEMLLQVRDCETGEFIGGLTLLGETGRLFSLKSVTKQPAWY